MMRFLAALLVSVLTTAPAAAIDLDYYTFGGFEATRNAFLNISLIFSDNQYLGIIFVVAVLGIALGFAIPAFRSLIKMGGGGFSIAPFMIVLLGAAVLQGLVASKGTVHVFDPVKNAYEPVADVPDLIVLTAGLFNKIERAVIDVVDDASAYPYGAHAGGIGFELLYGALTDPAGIDDYYAKRTIRRYWDDCSDVAMVSPASSFDTQAFRSGTTDLRAELAKLQSNSVFTVSYIADRSGVAESCRNVWTDDINPYLNAVSNFDGVLNSVCASGGFDVTNATQLAQCQDTLAEMNNIAFGTTADHVHLLRNIALARAVQDSIMDENPDIGIQTLSNTAIMSEGIGKANVANNWLPQVKAVLTAIIIGVTPFLVLFLLTPWAFKALSVLMGLFFFLTSWGVADAVIHLQAMDMSLAVFDEVRRHQMGFLAILTAPTQAQQSMALFSDMRGLAVGIATLVTAALTGISIYGMSQFASSKVDQVGNQGADASEAAIRPDRRQRVLEGNAAAMAGSYAVATEGLAGINKGAAFNRVAEARQPLEAANRISGQTGGSWAQSASAVGAIRGGASAGEASATISQAGSGDAGDVAFGAALVSRLGAIGGARGDEASARAMGYKDVAEANEQARLVEGMSRYADSSTVKEWADNYAADNPGSTRADGFDAIADVMFADRAAMMKVFGNDAGQRQAFMETAGSMEKERLFSYMNQLRDNDLSIADVMGARGTIQAAQDSGNFEAVASMDPKALVAAAQLDMLRGGARGGIATDIAESVGGMNALAERMETGQFVEQYARASNLMNHAEALNLEPAEAAERSNGAIRTYALTPQDGMRLNKRGVISEDQARAIMMSGGGQLEIGFDQDGNNLRSRVLAGDSVFVDYSDVFDSSERIHKDDIVTGRTDRDFSETRRSGTTVSDVERWESGQDFSPGSARDLVMDSSNGSRLVGLFKDLDSTDTTSDDEQFIRALGQDTSSILTGTTGLNSVRNESSGVDTRLQAGAGASAGVGTRKKGAQADARLTAGAGASTTWSHQRTSLDSLDANQARVRQLFYATRLHAKTEISERSFSSQEERDDAFYGEWASKFSDEYAVLHETNMRKAEQRYGSSRLNDLHNDAREEEAANRVGADLGDRIKSLVGQGDYETPARGALPDRN